MPGTALSLASPPGFFQIFFGIYGYFLPFMLYAAWSTLAFWDLARREDMGKAKGTVWVFVVLLFPFVGAIVYHAFGGSPIPEWLRISVVGGGLLVYVAVLVLGISVIGGGIS
jgi:hypothetical protein